MKQKTYDALVVTVITLILSALVFGVIIKERQPQTTNYILVTYETHYPNAIDTKTVSHVITKDGMKNGIKPYVTSRKGTDILKLTGGFTLARSSAPMRVVSYKYKTVTVPGKSKKK